MAQGVVGQIVLWGRLVKFSHSIFALPFALLMFAVVSRDHDVRLSQLLWIVVAMVAARTAAMAYNRLLDRDIDGANPRTAGREIPSGQVASKSVVLLVLLSSFVFFVASWQLGTHCLFLAGPVLAVLLLYSWMKRVTPYSHLVLGLALGLAPGGVWYALTAEVALAPIALMAAVLLWVAGFDILYACQDAAFDQSQGLFSIPSVFGLQRAFQISALLHVGCVALLVIFASLFSLGVCAYLGVALFAGLLVSQHRLVSPDDLSRLDVAFFSRNGTASVLLCVAVVADVLVAKLL